MMGVEPQPAKDYTQMAVRLLAWAFDIARSQGPTQEQLKYPERFNEKGEKK